MNKENTFVKFIKWVGKKSLDYAKENPEKVVDAMESGINLANKLKPERKSTQIETEQYYNKIQSRIDAVDDLLADLAEQTNGGLQTIYDNVQEYKKDVDRFYENTNQMLSQASEDVSNIKRELEILQSRFKKHLAITSALCGLGIVMAIIISIAL